MHVNFMLTIYTYCNITCQRQVNEAAYFLLSSFFLYFSLNHSIVINLLQVTTFHLLLRLTQMQKDTCVRRTNYSPPAPPPPPPPQMKDHSYINCFLSSLSTDALLRLPLSLCVLLFAPSSGQCDDQWHFQRSQFTLTYPHGAHHSTVCTIVYQCDCTCSPHVIFILAFAFK